MTFIPERNPLFTHSAALEDLLSLHLDSLLEGSPASVARLGDGLDLAAALEFAALVRIAEQLPDALPAITPDPAFVARLKQELITPTAPPLLIMRWRKLPPQAKLVARIGGVTLGATLGAGLVFLAGRGAVGVIAGLVARNKTPSLTPTLSQA